jgi:L-fuconolactonase
MNIDAHQHFWNYNPIRDKWINGSMEVLKRNFLPTDLKPLLKENGFDGCIAVQAGQAEDETEFLLKLAEENDFVKGVVGWVDLRNPVIEERLDYFSQFKNLKGFRHIVQAEAEGFMLQDDFQNGIKALRNYGFTYDILVYSTQLPDAIELVKAFPEQPFVLDHIGKPDIKSENFNLWKEQVTLFAGASNTCCKISGMVTEADWFNWKKDDFTMYLDHIFTSFGVDRLMIGSDWPVCLLSASYYKVVSIVTDYLDQFTEEEKAKVMGKNAQNFYNIK